MLLLQDNELYHLITNNASVNSPQLITLKKYYQLHANGICIFRFEVTLITVI